MRTLTALIVVLAGFVLYGLSRGIGGETPPDGGGDAPAKPRGADEHAFVASRPPDDRSFSKKGLASDDA